MKEKLAKLINVKSIVTLILTLVFAGLSAFGKISAEQFITIFTVIIGFYFGTQYQKSLMPKDTDDEEESTETDTETDLNDGEM